jgi:hypothetical protein
VTEELEEIMRSIFIPVTICSLLVTGKIQAQSNTVCTTTTVGQLKMQTNTNLLRAYWDQRARALP